jgi:hypothetical protein
MATAAKVLGWLFVAWFTGGQVYSEIRFWRIRRLRKAEAGVNPVLGALRFNEMSNHLKLRLLTLGLTGLLIWLLVR